MLEACVKISGLGFYAYFYEGWNKFDFVVVCASVVEVVLNQTGRSSLTYLRVGPQLARALRIVRVAKVVRIAKSLKDIQGIL